MPSRLLHARCLCCHINHSTYAKVDRHNRPARTLQVLLICMTLTRGPLAHVAKLTRTKNRGNIMHRCHSLFIYGPISARSRLRVKVVISRKAQFSKKIDLHSEIFHRKVKRSKLYSLFVCRARRRRWLVEYLLLEKF